MGIFYNSYISDYQKYYANIEVEMIHFYYCLLNNHLLKQVGFEIAD